MQSEEEEEEDEEEEEEEEEEDEEEDEEDEEDEEEDEEEVEVEKEEEEEEENDCWKNANAFLAKEVTPKASSLDSLEGRADEGPEAQALATPGVIFFFPPPELKRADVPTPLPLSLPSPPTEPLRKRKRFKAPEIESVSFLTIDCLLFPPFPSPAALLDAPALPPPLPLLAKRAFFCLFCSSI